jgi:translation elongation factor EF-1alpha
MTLKIQGQIKRKKFRGVLGWILRQVKQNKEVTETFEESVYIEENRKEYTVIDTPTLDIEVEVVVGSKSKADIFLEIADMHNIHLATLEVEMNQVRPFKFRPFKEVEISGTVELV